ncbi:DUF3021 domain-containing protein [Staphylococcus ratti]|uniref:DUF3021 domain-containing protein n=1 Tax=Staphylococcus ratti TaxID=2892440 RepID=A0ABY3PDA3_9STAP|nr:DUF3021 domain-containing protein [Staphylococcus ratti]UEX90223.1 DUF3021 domain-containing protein [Staphylococcus ratti]
MKNIRKSFSFGILMGLTLSIIFSPIFGRGHYYPLSPSSTIGEWYFTHFSEPIVMLMMVVIWGIIGVLFGQTSRIFEETDWSITRMTLTHFVITYIGFVPLATLAGWLPFRLGGLLSFTIIFIMIYIIVWICNYKSSKKMIKQINQQIKKR